MKDKIIKLGRSTVSYLKLSNKKYRMFFIIFNHYYKRSNKIFAVCYLVYCLFAMTTRYKYL